MPEVKYQDGSYTIKDGNAVFSIDETTVKELVRLYTREEVRKYAENSAANTVRNNNSFLDEAAKALMELRTSDSVMDEAVTEGMAAMATADYVMCPECGCTEFIGHQVCYHDAVFNIARSGEYFYVEDGEIYDADRAYSPFSCSACGYELEDE